MWKRRPVAKDSIISFDDVELDRDLVSVDPLEFADLRSYRARLQEARRETGVREAVTTGICKIGGQRAVLVVFDFAFLGGTMGSVATVGGEPETLCMPLRTPAVVDDGGCKLLPAGATSNCAPAARMGQARRNCRAG